MNASSAIILVGTGDKSLLDTYKGIEAEFLMHKENLVINPIYSIGNEGEKLILRRHFPSESFRKEFSISETYLPEEYVMDKRPNIIMNGRILNVALAELSEDDLHCVEYLMKRFIAINVPKNYF